MYDNSCFNELCFILFVYGNEASPCDVYCSLCDEATLPTVQCYSEFLKICRLNLQNELDNVNSTDLCVWDKVKRLVVFL